ncbi:MAG: acyl-CoA dehydrogenase family protein [bacterium]
MIPDLVDREETAEVAAYRQDLVRWLGTHLPPKPAFHLPQSFLEVESADQCEFLRAWQMRLYEAGYVGIDVPRAYGGHEGESWKQRIVAQELIRAAAPTLLNVVGLRMAMPTILTHGTEQQKQRFVQKILSAEEIWCQGFSEPNAGSDLASVQTFVKREGEHWVANGHKIWTTLGQFADFMILLGRTDKDASKHGGLSYFLMPMKARGVDVRPLVKMTREATFNQVHIEDVEMPLDALLGQLGQGWQVAMTTLLFERGAAGGSERDLHAAFEEMIARLADLAKRTQRGGRAMIDDAIIRDRLAALATEVEAIRHHITRVRYPALNDHPMSIPLMGKLMGSELMMRLHRLGQDILGPAATQWMDSPSAVDGGAWHLAFENAYGPIIGGGTSEIQRNIVGERVLGLAKG